MPTSATRRTSQAMRALAVLITLGILSTGCGGSGGDAEASPRATPAPASTPPLPTGYTRIDAGRLSLAYPEGWQTVQPPKGWAMAMELKRGSVAIGRLGVITSVPQTDDVDVVANTAFAGVQLSAAVEQRQPNQSVRVPGALAALRVDYTYEDRATGNKAQAADLSVALGGAKAVTLRITGVRDQLTPETINQILGTVTAKSS